MMAITPNKALIFLVGVVAAAGGTAYVSGAFDPYFSGAAPATVATLPAPAVEGKADPKDNRLPVVEPAAPLAAAPTPAEPADATAPIPEKPADVASLEPAPKPAEAAPKPAPAPAAVVPAKPAEAAMPAGVVAPKFDVVRVEGDGSMVIAGQAAPNAKVELLAGSKLLGETVAGPAGDFAVILDEPLKPGNYSIVLRSTAPGNVIAMSIETAIVSIPETQDGQVLAMVEEPGKPSEIISLPKAGPAPAAVNQPVAQAPATPEPPKPAETAAGDMTKPAEQAAAAAQAPAIPETPKPAETAAADLPKPVEQIAAADPATSTPPEAKPVDEAAAPKPAGQAEASLEAAPKPAPAAAAQVPVKAPPRVSVEAVEIEGKKIFVAGLTDPGGTVRGYANEILLGDAVASPDGRYLIETEHDLPVGEYIIRVDALESSGKVIGRAVVPFEREPGEAISAVASAPEAPSLPSLAPTVAQDATAPAAAQPKAPEAASKPEAVGDMAAASEPSTAGADATAKPAEQGAAKPLAQAAPMPATGGVKTDDALDQTASDPKAASTDAQADTVQSGEPAVDVAVASPEAASVDPGDGVPEIMAPKLKSVDSAVIIRRGDTLWRISRRVYGRGMRYSTIYLANQTQISNPDRIWPGQIFKVPDTAADGQPADMTDMGDQATTIQ